jgi:hypothetical protein
MSTTTSWQADYHPDPALTRGKATPSEKQEQSWRDGRESPLALCQHAV